MVNRLPTHAIDARYDMVLIGTGFGASFFLHKALQSKAGRALRVLALEWGPETSQSWRVANHAYSPIHWTSAYRNETPEKEWWFTLALGGGTNCWGANAPRYHPKDFALNSAYGVGRDWPYSYDALEPFYMEAERIMEIAGDDDQSIVIPRSGPFPQKPHRLSTPDRAMKTATPDRHFAASSGRRVTTKGQRLACCASMHCELCPQNSKFTIENGLPDLYAAPNVSVAIGARARRLETKAGVVSAVIAEIDGREVRIEADLVVLGANAIMSPFILLQSGLDGPAVGRYLHEKAGFTAEIFLKGMRNFDGGTRNTGVNYALYDGDFRRDSGAALVSTLNYWRHGLRPEPGRWLEVYPLNISVEDLPSPDNCVTDGGDAPIVSHARHSDYAERGVKRAFAALEQAFAALPIEDIRFGSRYRTHGHIQGTLRMGADPADSVVDADLIHHQLRNLVIVGSAVFPACGASNPSLTVAATALKAAAGLFDVDGGQS